jgi:hypothetical protein
MATRLESMGISANAVSTRTTLNAGTRTINLHHLATRTRQLKDFLNHLNDIHQCIQFTLETETEGYLPFLDTDIYRRPDPF